jgi:hypothetical protein
MKKIIYLAMSILLAGASFSFAQAEGMFTGSLPENWSADVVASGYLDVSIHQVCLRMPMYSACGYMDRSMWVFPFGHPRIKGFLRLTSDFRSLSRPSSPADA